VQEHANVAHYLGLIDKQQSFEVQEMAREVVDHIDKQVILSLSLLFANLGFTTIVAMSFSWLLVVAFQGQEF
jgi:hypothetical protein